MASSHKRVDSDSITVKERRQLPPGLGTVLEFTDGDERGRDVALVFERTILGRKNADVLVRDIAVSATHLAIEFRKGLFVVTDLGSSNGTFVEGIRIQEKRVELGQEVRIGACAFRLKIDRARAAKLLGEQPLRAADAGSGLSELIEKEFLRPDDRTYQIQDRPAGVTARQIRLRVTAGPDHGESFVFTQPNVIIGRVNADLSLKDPDVSRKHAILEQGEGGQVILRDLASANGTKVNRRPVSNCVLSAGDKIQVGKSTILFVGVERK
jgi:pSer/pThr/pTyr-binding forkhead associated (FHA) protein